MFVVFTAVIATSVGCADDGDLLYVKTSETQPDDPVYGRLVSVFAASGDHSQRTQLYIRVSGGILVDPVDPKPTEFLCREIPRDHESDKWYRAESQHVLEQRIAVIPTDEEAIIYALLRTNACDGTVRTEIAVPIQRAGDGAIVDGGT